MILSIIIPVYNRENKIRRCLDSLVNQDFKDFEVLIGDDNSTDNTIEICHTYDDKLNIKYFSAKLMHTDIKGPGKLRNRGLDIAQGDWLVFLDSDDYISRHDSFSQFSDILTNNKIKSNTMLIKTIEELRDMENIWIYTDYWYSFHRYFINNQFIKKFDLRFFDKYALGDDIHFLTLCLLYCKYYDLQCIDFPDKNFYTYVADNKKDSLMRENINGYQKNNFFEGIAFGVINAYTDFLYIHKNKFKENSQFINDFFFQEDFFNLNSINKFLSWFEK